MTCRGAWAAMLCGLLAMPSMPAGAAAPPHLDLDITLAPSTRSLQGVAQWEAPTRRLRIVLHESLAIEAVTLDDTPAEATAARIDGGMRRWDIRLPRPGAVRIRYAGTLPEMHAQLDHRGVLRALPPMASVRGSFLPAGSGWYPEPAHLYTYRVALSLPISQRGLVEGELVQEQTDEPAQAYRAAFTFTAPADGINLMAGPYVVTEKRLERPNDAPLRVRTYFYPELQPLAATYLDDTMRYLERYAAQIGPYPYAAFSVVAAPLPTGFGMPTLTYLGAHVLRLPFIRRTSLGHEVLHNWWGNGVRVDASRGNWSEGLTTFMADYAYQEDASHRAAAAQRLAWLRDFAAVPPSERQPLTAFRSRTHGAEAATGYGKAAMVFLMLRDRIGQDAFARGIRHFWETQRFRAAGWDDLQRAFAAAAGADLGWFFDQWLERSDAPALDIAQARLLPPTGAPGATLELTVTQQTPPYALRVPVEIALESGSEFREIEVRRARETVRLALAGRPTGVRLDPDMRLWRLLPPEQLPPIVREWIVARAPRVAVAAGTPEVREAAGHLAQALFEAPYVMVEAPVPDRTGGPVLLVGLHDQVAAALARAGLPPRPGELAGPGTAQVWTIPGRTEHGSVLVIAARDAAALRALTRPLPHYGGASWLVFEDARMVARGTWPARVPLVPVTR